MRPIVGAATALFGLPALVAIVAFVSVLITGRASPTDLTMTPFVVGLLVFLYCLPYALGALVAWAVAHALGQANLWVAMAIGIVTGATFGLIAGQSLSLVMIAVPPGGLLGIAVWAAAYSLASPCHKRT